MEERTGSFKAVKKKRGRFNAIDALIILLVIGVIVVFVVSRVAGSSEPGEDKKLEYTITVECVDKNFSEKINMGEHVYDSLSKILAGTVSAIKSDEAYFVYEYSEEENAIVKRTYPDKYNVEITISADAKFVDGVGYYVGGNRVAVGEKMSLRLPGCTAKGYCVGMREVK